MNDTANSRSFKPSDPQIKLIEDAFNAQDINFHADIGQFGGGNELPTYIETLHAGDTPFYVDFGDYKYGYSPYIANFDSDGESIWRYMISGYNFAEDTDSSGIAEVSGSNIFVSYGLVKEEFVYSDENDALAGTMIHELGHTLCLSPSRGHTEQPSECIYGGVDSDSILYLLYPSAMNYRYQFDVVDYSDGANSLFDHDDWSAIKLGVSNFSGTRTYPGASKQSTDVKVAIDIDKSVINEMTPEKSRQIYEQKQAEKENASPPNPSPDAPIERELTNKPTTQSTDSDSTIKETTTSNDSPDYTWMTVTAGAVLVSLVGVIIVMTRNKNQFKRKK